ncbi:MAG: class I SAM-dependent methyltransferase [[Clostridium] scindens]|uniref:class I SAM-dependent methyltransferase n=1 Tax=Clostridium scindens (strain JCM 10418 / VPI 12708) TaxID=29347 RepID=UPI00399ACD23
MEEIRRLLAENLNDMFIHAVLSNPRTREGWSKVKARPVLIKGVRMVQLEMFRGNQAFHQNVGMEEAGKAIAGLMESMKQMQLETTEALYTVLISKKGKVTVKRKTQKKEPISADMSHNRKKQYILREGVPVPFLTDLGVMTEEGNVIRSRFDKFRQINRFLEFIEDILPQLEREREVTILDFGCGKSYLTFAMYYYLHELKGYDVRIIGLDLKSDVIRRCNELSEKYGYGKLRFLEGNIADYTGAEKVDMVVTLHACDTATDFALAKAVRWDAKVILSVPCCQHELNAQMKNDVLGPVMKYGLLKERFAALVTDGLRAQYLEREGYDAQILEFIDMEHTPKNILIRAVKTGRKGENQDTIDICEEFLHVSPALGRLLDEKGEL